MRNEANLKRALAANAAFSAITGLGALALAERLAESLGPPTWALRALGGGLLAFAVLVALEARTPARTNTKQIIAADLAWVVAAIAIIWSAPSWLTGTGRIVVAGVTLIVAALATAQWRGLEAAP